MAKYKVKFKENYMPRAVERTCDVPSKDEIVRIYNSTMTISNGMR